MKKIYLLLTIVSLIYWGCEDEQKLDTTPPSVTVTFPQNNSSVSEMISITCISSDNEGVEKVELWVNGATTGLTDNSEPYSFDWNTTLVDNGDYTITIRSYDTSDNTTDSEPMVLTVDNTQSNPQPINITSVIFDNGGFTITWNQSIDGDFSRYELEKSTDSTMNNPSVVFTSDSLKQTTYFDTDVDPLIYQYYRVTVIDTFEYENKGEIVSSTLDPVPLSVNVESVEYTLEEMTISWSESPDGDFKHYHLLTSGSESGDKSSVVTITNKLTTSHTITEFNPNNENWYWVEVSDTLGQTSIGTGITNSLNNVPTSVNVTSVTYDLESMTITWEDYVPNLSRINQMNQNIRSKVMNDFLSYELLQSDSEDGNYTSVVEINDPLTTSHNITEFDPTIENWFKIKVTDYWGSNSLGYGMSNNLDNPPISPVISPILYYDGFQINWSRNNDSDFKSYKIYESIFDDMRNLTLIYETTEREDTNYVIIDANNDKYYQIFCEDIWGLKSNSNIEVLHTEIELWGQYYSVLNTTSINLEHIQLIGPISPKIGYLTNLEGLTLYWTDLTGSIPSEIGNLTNLTVLSLSGNGLEGFIPPEIGNLTNLVILNLKNNLLYGSIPPELGNLVNLSHLDLSWNELEGSFPPQIGNLVNLTSLNLVLNNLTGVIPESICDLNINWSFPSRFNISQNQLCPPYPPCIENYMGYQEIGGCD